MEYQIWVLGISGKWCKFGLPGSAQNRISALQSLYRYSNQPSKVVPV